MNVAGRASTLHSPLTRRTPAVDYGRAITSPHAELEFVHAARVVLRDVLARCTCCGQEFRAFAMFPYVTAVPTCFKCKPTERLERANILPFVKQVPMAALTSMEMRRRALAYPDVKRYPSWRVVLRAFAFAWLHRRDAKAGEPGDGALLGERGHRESVPKREVMCGRRLLQTTMRVSTHTWR